MNLTIMNYRDEKVDIDIGDNVATITINVISGDEVAEVTYKDFTRKWYDSSVYCQNLRALNFYDESYEVYNFQNAENLIDNPLWKNRETSYDLSWEEEE